MKKYKFKEAFIHLHLIQISIIPVPEFLCIAFYFSKFIYKDRKEHTGKVAKIRN